MNEFVILVDEPTARSIFLAPHYDDVALSCGGLVAALAADGDSPLIVTVFGGTPTGQLTDFAMTMHRQWGFGPEDAVAMRRKEESCAAAALGAESMWLDFLDAIYRDGRYMSDPDIFGEIDQAEWNLANEIVNALIRRDELSLSAPGIIYVPLAIGNHVDHQHVLAVGRLLALHGHDVWTYEDFPYAGDPQWRNSIAARASEVTSNESRVVALTEAQLAQKVRAVLCYKSQLDIIFRHQGDPAASVRRYASSVGGGRPAERFWRL